MPDLAPPVAPAAPAPSAPTPAAVSAPPVAPAPVAAPPVPAGGTPAPVAAPVPAAPVKFDAATSLTPPDKSAYPQTEEGFEQHGTDLGEWVMQHPEEAQKLKAERLGESPASEPGSIEELAAKVEGEDKPAEAPKAEAVAAPTPAKLEEWTTTSPELKAAFEKNPGLQAEIMQMARDNEAAKPILEKISTPQEADFLIERANTIVSLEANWMLAAEDPEMVETAWGQLEEMFKSRNDKGEEIKDATGKVQFDADYKPFVSKAANVAIQLRSAPLQARVAAVEAQLAAKYPDLAQWDTTGAELQNAIEDETNPQVKELLDQYQSNRYAISALKFAIEAINFEDDGSRLPELPPNATPEQVAFQKQLEQRQKELDEKSGKQTVETRKAARVALDNKIGRTWSKEVGDKIDAHVNAMKERGEYLPDFVLTDKWINPQTQKVTGVTDFGTRVWQALNNKIFSNPTLKASMARLQAMGPAGEAARQAELTRLTNLYLPKIIEGRVKEIQDGIRNAGKKTPVAGAPASPARVEPSTTATVIPQASGSDDAAMRKLATAEAMKNPDWAVSTPADREAMVGEIFLKKKFWGQ